MGVQEKTAVSATEDNQVGKSDAIDDRYLLPPQQQEIRWALIGDYLSQICRELTSPRATIGRAHGDLWVLSAPDDGLTDEEAQILKGWFSPAELPKSESWEELQATGRPRSQIVWPHSPEAILPVLSRMLDWLTDTPQMDHSFTERIQDSANRAIKNIPVHILTKTPKFVARIHGLTTISPKGTLQ